MNEQNVSVAAIAPATPVTSDSGSELIDFFIIFAKRKKLVIGLPIVIVAITAAVIFSLPRSYSANAKLLPPQQAQSGAAALLSQLGGAASAATGISAGIKTPNDLYVGMLKSRTIADRLIARFNLKQVYDTSSQEQARRSLEAKTAISVGKDGLMLIEVESTDRKLAPALANGYVAELLKLTTVLAVTEASQRRLFFERQLEIAKDNLAEAENSLKGGLESRGVINVDSDSRAIIETIARLRAQASAKEVQLSSMRAFVTPNNQDYKRAQEELLGIRSELSKLENGRPGNEPPISAKSVGLQSMKTLRDVKYYQMLYELLAKQYEVARLDEAKDTAIIQVLDPAIEPERPSKPRRALVLLSAALLGMLASLSIALLLEANERALSTPVGAGKRVQLRRYLWRNGNEKNGGV